MHLTCGNASSQPPDSGVEIIPGGMVFDLEYADEVVLLNQNLGSLYDLLYSLDKFAPVDGVRFAPSKCKMMPLDGVVATTNLSVR